MNTFMRRFLMHILPPRFRKIRHYGIFASRDRIKRLKFCRLLTGTKLKLQSTSVLDRLESIRGKDFDLCPCCNSGHLLRASPKQGN